MSNVIDLNSFRKKQSAQKELASSNLPNASLPDPTTPSKLPSSAEDRFLQDAMNFKFQRMSPPVAFVVVNQTNLPSPFPSEPTPPMAA